MGCSDLDSIAKDNMQRLYANAFMLLGSKHDAEDAAEEAIYQLYRRKPEFESDEHARAWLIRVTVNAALKQLRRRKFISDNSENELDAAAVDFDFSDRSDIIKAVHSLPTKLRLGHHKSRSLSADKTAHGDNALLLQRYEQQ